MMLRTAVVMPCNVTVSVTTVIGANPNAHQETCELQNVLNLLRHDRLRGTLSCPGDRGNQIASDGKFQRKVQPA